MGRQYRGEGGGLSGTRVPGEGMMPTEWDESTGERGGRTEPDESTGGGGGGGALSGTRVPGEKGGLSGTRVPGGKGWGQLSGTRVQEKGVAELSGTRVLG